MSQAVYRAIAADLRRQIVDGALPVGARLPSERDLAARYFVSLFTVQRCIRLLAGQGFLRSVPGHGVYVADDPGLGSFRRVVEALDRGTVPEVEDVRVLRDLVRECWAVSGGPASWSARSPRT